MSKLVIREDLDGGREAPPTSGHMIKVACFSCEVSPCFFSFFLDLSSQDRHALLVTKEHYSIRAIDIDSQQCNMRLWPLQHAS